MITESDGLKWIVDEEGVDAWLGPSNHEAELAPFLEGDGTGIFFDVGADVGRWTLRLAPTYEKVYAFEPHPGRERRLKQNLELNGIDNVVVLPVAASDVEGFSTIGRIGTLGEGSEGARLVPLDRLDLEPTMIKIDVESHESHVLRGMTDTARKCRPRILVEMHHKIYGQWVFDEVAQWMRELEYNFEQVAEINRIPYWMGSPQ